MSQSGQFISIDSLGAVASLTGDAGGAIVPVAGNIDILGGAGITVTGTPGTLTIAHGGEIADSFPTDAGTAVPVAGDTNILGGTNINTTGAGNTVTVILDDDVTLAGFLNAGTTVTAGTGITSTTGDITSSAGDVVAQNNVTATTGTIAASAGAVTAGTTVTAGTGITATTGNIVASTGNITSTLGSLEAATTVTAGTGITATTGTIAASAGAVTASTTVTGGTGVIATTGNVTSSAGDVIAQNNITSNTGNFTAFVGTITSGGNISSSGGSVTAATTVVGGTGAQALTGNISADGGTVFASVGVHTFFGNISAGTGDVVATLGAGNFATTVTAGTGITATTGNITASTGNLVSTLGSVGAATSVSAGTTLTAGTTVTFTSITNGGLLVDGAGVVSASTAITHATGFATWGGAGNYFDDTVLGSFEVLRPGTGYIDSVEVAWAGSQTVTGMTAGNTYLIYMDSTGTIGKTTSFSMATFDDYIVLFECLRDSSGTNIQYTVKENHPYRFCSCVSFYCHEVIGTVIENNDQGANITLNGTQKIEIVGADELADHGLYTDIPDGGGVPETWHNMLTNGAGKWITYRSNDTFNGWWNDAGTATAPSGTKYSIYTLYVGKDTITVATPTYWAVLDDQEYNNLAAAQTAIANGTMAIATAELAKLEFAQLGHIIYKQSTDTIVDVIIEKSTLRGTTSGGGGTNQASLVLTDVTLFDGILSAADTTVQVALDTIDEWGKTTTDHAVLIGNSTGSPIGSLAVGTNGQLLTGSTGADPVFATVASADGSIEITGGAGTIDLYRGKMITCSNAAAITVTVPVNADVAMDIGTNILIMQLGAGVVTLAPEGGVTLRSRGSLLDTAGQYAICSITKILTNEWAVGGDVA